MALIGALMRSLPGGLGRFVPCSVGADHCRLRHVGWERCSHGPTSRPRENASGAFLDQLLLLFQYPPPVRCLMGHFLFGIVLLSLLVGFFFGLYLYLVMLLDWLLLKFRLLKLTRLRLLVGRFIGLVVVVLVGQEFD